MAARKTTEQFIQDAREVHGDRYDYDVVDYKTNKKKVKITCPEHGVFEQRPDNHLMGKGCFSCYGCLKKTTKQFIKESKDVHKNRYIYDFVNYKTGKEKVKIKCREHGLFEQLPTNHLNGSGCPNCVNVAVKTTEQFIQDSRKVHGDRYDYDLVNYKTNKKKVKIKCSKHGVFNQIPNSHLDGRGCHQCSVEYVSEINKDSPTGWSYSNWERAAKNSKNFHSFKLYVIKCYNPDLGIYFYKIGRTFRKLNKRFYKSNLPYSYEIIYMTQSENARKICELEQEYKNKCKEHSYSPVKYFRGMNECYTSIDSLNLQLD